MGKVFKAARSTSTYEEVNTTHNQIAARYRKLLTRVLELDSEDGINSRWDPPIYKLADTYSRGMSHITARGMDASILEDIADHIEDIEEGG